MEVNKMTQVCLVTGSSRGIGLAIAKYLADQDYQVVLNSRKPIDEETLNEFADATHPVGTVIGDISEFDTAKKIIKQVINDYGQLNVLVNNAGINKDGLIMRMTEEDFDQVIQTNLTGTFNMCRHATKHFLKQKSGTIINMSSVVGLMGNAGQTNYAASKAGVVGLTKSLARELASRSITVNAIAPGYIETDMTGELSEKISDQLLSQIPLKRFGQVDEVAQCVDFLIQNRYVTGQVLEVNGGLHI